MNETAPKDAHMATDPVCGMMVDTHAGKPTRAFRGNTYFFCSEGCRTKFAADPTRYLDKTGEPEPLPAGTLYTCPMHPQIVQEGPGPCPICGMALEPMGALPEDTDNPELIDFTRRLWVAAPLALALLALDMGAHGFGVDLLPFLSAQARAMAEARSRHSGGAVERLAVLRARDRLDPLGLAQHVHADRARHRRGVPLQRRRHGGARTVPAVDARRSWPDPHLFRGGRGDRGARAARPGARASGAREDGRRYPRAARPCAQDRVARARRTARPRQCRSPRSRSATCCGSDPATRSRSTAP